MSAKPAKKDGRKASYPAALASESAAAHANTNATATAPAAPSEAAESWLHSPDPRRRTLGRVLLAGIWLYVAALWLLALDQWLNWGIFGPTVPPVS